MLPLTVFLGGASSEALEEAGEGCGVGDGATTHLTDNAREIGCGDAEVVGIEGDVAMLDEMLRQQLYEAEVELFDAWRETMLRHTSVLNDREVNKEEAIEQAQALIVQRVLRLLVMDGQLATSPRCSTPTAKRSTKLLQN